MFALGSNDVLGYDNDEHYCKFCVNFLHNILLKSIKFHVIILINYCTVSALYIGIIVRTSV